MVVSLSSGWVGGAASCYRSYSVREHGERVKAKPQHAFASCADAPKGGIGPSYLHGLFRAVRDLFRCRREPFGSKEALYAQIRTAPAS